MKPRPTTAMLRFVLNHASGRCSRLAWLGMIVCVVAPGRVAAQVNPDDPTYRPATPPPQGRLGVGFSGELPQFVVQVPDTKSEVSGDVVARLGLSWVRDWLAGTPYETDEPLIQPPLRLPLPFLDKVVYDVWFVGRLGFTPVGAAAGFVTGAREGESARKLERALPAVGSAMEEVQMQAGFEPLLLALLREKLPGLSVLTNRLPHESTFHQPERLDREVPLPPEWRGMRRVRSESAAFGGADAGVILRVVSWGLMGRHGHNKLLSVNVVVKGTVVNIREGTRVREFYTQYESPRKKFVEWSVDGGKALRDELRQSVQSIARQIAGEMPPPPPPPAQPVL